MNYMDDLPMYQWKYLIERYRFEAYQGIYWLLYGALTFVNNSFLANPFRWWEVLLTIAFVMAFIYSIVYVFFRMRKPWATMLAIFVGMFVAYALLFYVVAFVWHPPLGNRLVGTTGAVALGAYLFTMFLHWYHAMIEGGLLAAIYRIRGDERQKRKLMEENYRTQLQFLMAQIDPHEQYNMLDIPYELALKRGEKKIADALLELKAYFQYVQEKAAHMESEVVLADELAHCRRIIAVNRRRFDEVCVSVAIPDELHGWQVPALSISSVLQNAFKYGVSWDRKTPVSLRVQCDENQLKIVVRNKVNPHKRGQRSAGIGNENIRRRLKLLYGERACLDTRQTDDGWYETKLTLTK